MAHPFTRAQALENSHFLDVLAQTGNARLAARAVRRAHSTMHERRSTHACFAQRWDAALAAAHARFHLSGGKRGPEGLAPAGAGAGEKGKVGPGLRRDDERKDNLRTLGGEPVVVRTKNGTLQLRPAHPNKLTKAAEQAFLAALSASANVRLSAAAAGASARAFYRRRERDPAFAREMRLALAMGYERLEAAAIRAALPQSHEHDLWRQSAPPPIPPMSPDQALQLLFLHEKSVHQSWEKPHRRKRRGEPWETYTERLRAMWTAEKRQEAEDAALRRAARYEESGDWRFESEAPPIALPPLHLVTGWSRADPSKPEQDREAVLAEGRRVGELRSSHRSDTSMGARKIIPSKRYPRQRQRRPHRNAGPHWPERRLSRCPTQRLQIRPAAERRLPPHAIDLEAIDPGRD